MLFCAELWFYLLPKWGLIGFRTSCMDKLSFWHKLAFLSNICWLMATGMRYGVMVPGQNSVVSTVLVVGLLMAYLINTLVNIWTAYLLIVGRLNARGLKWLIIVNFLYLLAQLYLFLT